MVSRYLFDTFRHPRRKRILCGDIILHSRQGIIGIHMTELYYYLMRLFILHVLCVYLSSSIDHFR